MAPHVARPRGQLFFLFLVYDKISNEEIWQRFFASAVQGVDYRVFVHCKTALCRQNVRNQGLFELIPSVETHYCTNLVGGMNALLRAALEASSVGSPYDKMVFASDSTLPVKPFHYVQHRLTSNPGSDFCIFPRSLWAEVQQGLSQKQVGVKHHQWIVLSRAHAKLAVEREPTLPALQISPLPGGAGCLDEYWHFQAIFPGLELAGPGSFMGLEGVNGGSIYTGDADLQGQCDTYLHWSQRAQGMNNNLTALSERIVLDPGTDVSAISEHRPSTFTRLSKASLMELRGSWFLFMRKVDDASAFSGCGSLAEAFDALVFSDPPRQILGDTPTWAGQGTWLDNRGAPVTLTAVDGAVRLAWVTSGRSAKGSYCADRISMTFSNGYKASANLEPGGKALRWSNGVRWQRSI